MKMKKRTEMTRERKEAKILSRKFSKRVKRKRKRLTLLTKLRLLMATKLPLILLRIKFLSPPSIPTREQSSENYLMSRALGNIRGELLKEVYKAYLLKI